MSDLFLLSDRQLNRIQPFFRCRMACHAWMTGAL
jgi:hypothetical protein